MILSGIELNKFQGRYYRILNESVWILVMRHNCENGTKFANNEALYSTKDLNKYSIISKLDAKKMKINGKFEFMAEYPKYHEGYNHWRQTNNPIFEEDTTTNVTGFEPIHTDIQSTIWCGLAKSSTAVTLLDGTRTKGNWNYAFGANSLLGGYIPTYRNEGTKDLFLWLKLPSISSLSTLGSTIRCTNNHLMFHVAMLITFIVKN